MVDVSFATPQERVDIATFMAQVFPKAKWDAAGWMRLLDGRWAGQAGPYAITVRDAGRLVGVLGLVTATRPDVQGGARTANMSSWYLLKEYRRRGLGQAMIAAALSVPDATVTNLTSARAALPVVLASGLAVLDDTRLIWPATGNAPPLSVRDASADDTQIIRDHAGLNIAWQEVTTPDGPVTCALSIKRKHDAYMTHEVLHVSAPQIFAAHAAAIADSLLPPSAAVLAVDARLVPGAQGQTEPIAVPRLYSPDRLAPAQLDHLYSEIVLLDMKLP
jgi:hypothetical protein